MVNKDINIKLAATLLGKGLTDTVNGLKKVDDSAKKTSNTLKETSKSVDTLGKKSTFTKSSLGGLGGITNNIKSSFGGLQTTVTGLHNKIGGLKGAMGGLKGAMSGMNGIMSGLIGVGITAFLQECITKARTAKDEWRKFNAALAKSGVSLEIAKKDITKLALSNGFLVGETRSAEKTLLNFGLTHEQVAGQSGALRTAMALSVLTNHDLESSTKGLAKAYAGKGIALKTLGIEVNKYKDASTGLVNQEKLNQAILEKGATQLEEHGHSYEANMLRFEGAMNTLKTALGTELLPMFMILIDAGTGLVNMFNSLPGPIKAVIAVGLGLIGAALTLGPVLIALGPIFDLIALGLVKVSVAEEGATLSTILLEASLGPILLIILAITAAVAIGTLIWSKYGNEITAWAQNAYTWLETIADLVKVGDWGSAAERLGEGFQNAGQILGNAGQQIINSLGGVWNYLSSIDWASMLGSAATSFVNFANNIVDWLISGLGSLSGMLDELLTSMLAPAATGSTQEQAKATGETTGTSLMDGLMTWLTANGPKIVDTIIKVLEIIYVYIPIIGLKIGTILLLTLYQALSPLGHYLLQPFWDAGLYIQGAWNNTVAWIQNGVNIIISSVYGIYNAIVNAFQQPINIAMGLWNSLVGLIGGGISTVVAVASGAIQWAINLWNTLKSAIGGGISTAVNVAYGALQSAYNTARWLLNTLQTIAGRVWNAVTNGGGPAGPVGIIQSARGSGLGLHYENYAGHQKNAWNSAGTCLTGNCVDMTLGLMSRYGGGMVAGTWNGGPHVWWQAPSGQQLDPARKALDGTWTPPARGPHDPSFGNTIIIQGDIYGFEDFKKKVEDANAKIFYDAARF